MIVSGSILAINLTHRLTDRLTEADADSHRIVGSGHTGHELQTALQLLAKIQQEGWTSPLPALDFTHREIGQVGLSIARFQQLLHPGNQIGLLLPNNTGRRQIDPCTTVALLGCQRSQTAESDQY